MAALHPIRTTAVVAHLAMRAIRPQKVLRTRLAYIPRFLPTVTATRSTQLSDSRSMASRVVVPEVRTTQCLAVAAPAAVAEAMGAAPLQAQAVSAVVAAETAVALLEKGASVVVVAAASLGQQAVADLL